MVWEKWVSRYLLVQFRFFTRKYKWAKHTLLMGAFLSLLYLAQAKPAAVLGSKPPGLNSDWQCSPYCLVSRVGTENISKQEHKCLSSSPTCMIMQNILLSKNSIAVQECLAGTAGLGGSIAVADYRCSAPNSTFFSWCKTQKGALKHYSHKCCGGGAGTVNNTLLVLWCTSCSITQLSHNCLLDLLNDDFRLFQAVLFLLVLYRKKKKEQ